MALRVVGAGLGRTGTASLQLALQQLLDGRCYHMGETFGRPDDIPVWHAAANGDLPDWNAFLAEFVATVDWPACAFWRELAAANPDALILLSTRDSPQQWWVSMQRTIVPTLKAEVPADQPELARHRTMTRDLLTRRFTQRWDTREDAIAAYESHNEDVRRTTDRARLIDWRPQDGWEPICAALGVPIPDVPFPHDNSTSAFRDRQGLLDR